MIKQQSKVNLKNNKKASAVLFILIGILVLACAALLILKTTNNQNASTDNEDESDNEKESTHMQIITCTDENSSTIITENISDKTADIEINLYLDSASIDVVSPFLCIGMQMAFFNETSLEEFNKQITAWNQMEITMDDENGINIGVPENDFLAGYTITKVIINFKDKITEQEIKTCTITGPSESQVICN